MPEYLLINYSRSVRTDNSTVITAQEASYSLDSNLNHLGELGQWHQDISRLNPGDSVQLQDYLRRARVRENQIEGIDPECVEPKLMEIIGTIHANAQLNTQDWGIVQLPHLLILQERETGVRGSNDGILRIRGEDGYEAGEQSELVPVEQSVVDAAKQEHDEGSAKETNEEPVLAKEWKSEAEACRDLLRKLEQNPETAKQERNEAEACRDLLRQLESNPG
jgi:hypothetical protein